MDAMDTWRCGVLAEVGPSNQLQCLEEEDEVPSSSDDEEAACVDITEELEV